MRDDFSLVTCLCLTIPGRGEFLKRAVDCFRHQTYERKQLLIVADSWSDTESMLDEFGAIPPGYSISIYIPLRKPETVGEKRNLGIESAHSDLIAIWDDDDFSAPGRLESQVKELEITRKSITGYTSMKFTDGSAWWSFRCGAGLAIGSSLMFRREWWETHRYPEIQVGEEAVFCEAAAAKNQIAEVPDLNLMYATIHPGNTSKRRPDRDPGWRALLGFQWPGTDNGIRKAWDAQRKA